MALCREKPRDSISRKKSYYNVFFFFFCRWLIKKVDGKKKGGGINVPLSLDLLLARGEAKKLTTEIKAVCVLRQIITGK